jgi:hypothetical protein
VSAAADAIGGNADLPGGSPRERQAR